MKQAFVAAACLLVMGVLAGTWIAHELAAGWQPYAAILTALAWVLGAVVALSSSPVARFLRHRALNSAVEAAALPLLLLLPYLVFAVGAREFSAWALLKLALYVALPALFLLPDRLHAPKRITWRDAGAMISLALPVAAGLLHGIWSYPGDVYFFQPLYAICAGAYAFIAVRGMEGIGYRLGLRRQDCVDGVSHFVAFSLLAIPLGVALGFLHFHHHAVGIPAFAFQLFAIYLTIAIPEELLFRAILQNLITASFGGPRAERNGLIVTSVIFGLSHLHHPPVPNWRYALLATLAGLFYGNVYRLRGRTSASALTHALVDTIWHYWL